PLSANNAPTFPLPGIITTAGSVIVNTPLITGASGAAEAILAAGSGAVEAGRGFSTPAKRGVRGQLLISGASITENSNIILHSGALTLYASGDISVGGSLDLSGTAQTFFDVTSYTNGGLITLDSTNGSVSLTANSLISVAAQIAGGNA